MKKSVSTVVATVIMLVITIALMGSAWVFVSGIFTRKTATAFSIIDVNYGNVTIRNEGTSPISSMRATVDGQPIAVLFPEGPIQPGNTGIIILQNLPATKQIHTLRLTTDSMTNTWQWEYPIIAIYDADGENFYYQSWGRFSSNQIYDWLNSAGFAVKKISSDEIATPFTMKSRGKTILVVREYCGGNNFRTRLEALGYNVIVDTTVSTVDDVKKYNPDIVACLTGYCSCNAATLMNQLYNLGYRIFTNGNDNGNSIIPISSAVGTSVAAGTISIDKSHPINNGVTTIPNSGSDWRTGITAIHPNAICLYRDFTNNFCEAIYLEESGKGKWYEHHPYTVPSDTLLKQAINWLLSNGISEFDIFIISTGEGYPARGKSYGSSGGNIWENIKSYLSNNGKMLVIGAYPFYYPTRWDGSNWILDCNLAPCYSAATNEIQLNFGDVTGNSIVKTSNGQIYFPNSVNTASSRDYRPLKPAQTSCPQNQFLRFWNTDTGQWAISMVKYGCQPYNGKLLKVCGGGPDHVTALGGKTFIIEAILTLLNS